MKRTTILLLLILVLGAFLRIFLCYDIPVSGDESASILQAAGKAAWYSDFCQQQFDAPIPAAEMSWFLEYSGDYGFSKVAESMAKAGMHPPMYYWLLHCVLRFFGNDVLLLRCVSILFSLGSIAAVYLIGSELKDSKLSLLAALLCAVSTYAVKFSLMIRPYPMVMFIALLSTWVVLNWSKKDRYRFTDVHFWAILILSVAGFYSIYHFVFHLAFLWSFLFMKCLSRKKDFLVMFSIPVITGLVFSLWVPGLWTQMQVVKQGNFYFNALCNPIAGVGQLITLNFTKFLPIDTETSVIILAFLVLLGLAGLWAFIRSSKGIFFIASLAVYIVANTTIDLIMGTNTICVNKLAFFLNPVSLLFLAAGALFITERFGRKFLVYPIVIGLAATHLYFGFSRNLAVDAPYDKTVLKTLDREISPVQNKLVVMSQPWRREVFSFLHPIQSPPDVVFTRSAGIHQALARIDDLEKYEVITLFYYRSDDTPQTGQLEEAQQFLKTRGYRVKAKYPCTSVSIILLEKDAETEPVQDGSADTVSRHRGSQNRTYNCAQNLSMRPLQNI